MFPRTWIWTLSEISRSKSNSKRLAYKVTLITIPNSTSTRTLSFPLIINPVICPSFFWLNMVNLDELYHGGSNLTSGKRNISHQELIKSSKHLTGFLQAFRFLQHLFSKYVCRWIFCHHKDIMNASPLSVTNCIIWIINNSLLSHVQEIYASCNRIKKKLVWLYCNRYLFMVWWIRIRIQIDSIRFLLIWKCKYT